MWHLFVVGILLLSVGTLSSWTTTTTPFFLCHAFAPPLPYDHLSTRTRAKQQVSSSSSTTSTSTSSRTSCLFGIPKMFRWLTDQYPNINRRLQEGLSSSSNSVKVVNHFYLDMNGIIHPCTHGNAQGEIIVLDETLMFQKIFSYVDRLYKLVQPNTTLYLAVDGVAPRAKMNQQRSRRFKSAKEAEATALEVLIREGQLPEGTKFDSNCITPGTDFMLKLSLALQKWVDYKLQTDPFWQHHGAQVIHVSGPDVPGEGEHKVMDFIREQQQKSLLQQQEENIVDGHHDDSLSLLYHKDDTHVLYGLDADLIMLGLVTHEPNFLLLREKMSVVMAGRGGGRGGGSGKHMHRRSPTKKKDMMDYDHNDFEVLELKSLRQLLAIQFRPFADQLQENYDLSRIIDDFVFMCILVGNDFLSRMPHLEIDSGAISLMMTTYTDLVPEWNGYLTDKEKIHPQRFEQFLHHLGTYEEEYFRQRGVEENEPGWRLSSDNEQDEEDFYGVFYGGGPTPTVARPANHKGSVVSPPASIVVDDNNNNNNKQQQNVDRVDGSEQQENANAGSNRAFRRKHPDSSARSYRDFYYETKLNWSHADKNSTLLRRRAHVRDYLEGLHWVLNYYHNGCPSWDWYFPHLYSPLCTDMVNLDEFYNDDQESEEFKSFPFDLGTPFPSLAQLLSVLPPQSAELLPDPLAELMVHPSSPLVTYYPKDFTTDPNGKRQSWEAIVQIPFIDADVLLETVQQIMQADELADAEHKLLTNAERRRNVLGKSHVFVAPHRTGEVACVEKQPVAVEATTTRSRTTTRKSTSKPRSTGTTRTNATAERGSSSNSSRKAAAPSRRRSPPKQSTSPKQ